LASLSEKELKMGAKAVGMALEVPVGDPLAKLILIAVADHWNQSTGDAWPSVDRLVTLTESSRSTVLRKLKLLEDKGLIQRTKRYNKTDLYQLTFLVGVTQTRVTETPLEVSERHTNSYRTLKDINIKTSKKQKTLFCEWQPTDAEREKLVTYCNSHGHELDDILEDMRLWDDANGNQAKYACHSSAVMRWCRTTRNGKKATQGRLKRQQSVSEGKRELSDKQIAYAETVAKRIEKELGHQGYVFKLVYPDIIAFMESAGRYEDWDALGNGLPNPKEKGWM
jgi:hypothetical protein